MQTRQPNIDSGINFNFSIDSVFFNSGNQKNLVPPPPGSLFITTEDGLKITTEDGTPLITEG